MPYNCEERTPPFIRRQTGKPLSTLNNSSSKHQTALSQAQDTATASHELITVCKDFAASKGQQDGTTSQLKDLIFGASQNLTTSLGKTDVLE